MKLTCIITFVLALGLWSPSAHDSDPHRWGKTHTVPRLPPHLGSHFLLVRKPWLWSVGPQCVNKPCPSSETYGFSSSHVSMWELDPKEGWALKNWCFWTVLLEKTLENPWDREEIKPVHPKGNQLWIFTGRTDAKAEAPILWPPSGKSWLTGKEPDAGRDWMQEKKRLTGWDGWISSLTQWTWVWASFGSYWKTEKSGMLQSMGLQSQTQLSDWTELIWNHLHSNSCLRLCF